MSKVLDLTEIRIQVHKALDPKLSIHMDNDGRIGVEYRVNEVMKIVKKALDRQTRPNDPCPGYCDVCMRHCQLERKSQKD